MSTGRGAASLMCLLTLTACNGGGTSGPGSGATATVTVTPAQATLDAIGGTQQLTAVVKDGSGNVLTGKAVSWVSSATGVASVSSTGLVTAVANGSATITATVDGKAGQAAITVAQVATRLVVSRTAPAQGNTKAGEAFSVLVEAQDAGGAVVAAFSATVAIALSPNAGNATLSGTTSASAQQGRAQFPGAIVTRMGNGYTLVATSGNLVSSPSAAFAIDAGPLAQFAFLTPPPASAEGNVPMGTVVVEQRDAHGNVVTGGSITLKLAGAPWPRTRLLGTLTAATVNGRATFNDLRVDRPGTGYRLEAESGTVTSQSGTFVVVASFTSVSVGGTNSGGSGFSCAIAPGGTFCWGINDSNQLTSRAAFWETVPFLIDAPVAFVEVTAGYLHACGRTASGEVWCWGGNGNGQLGDGSTQDATAPVKVTGSGPGGNVFTGIDAGQRHTCGIVGAEAWCWGRNLYGQLGNATMVDQSVPVKVAGTGAAPLNVVLVSAGVNHSCAVTTTSAAWCWGAAFAGALGDGQETVHQSAPVQVAGSGAAPLVFGIVSAGIERTCAVTTGNPAAIYCWGNNAAGYLGIGAPGGPGSVLAPTQVSAPGANFLSVSTSYNTTCGVEVSGSTWCWGRGVDGEIGNGLLANQSSPAPVTIPAGGLGRISAGGANVCALQLGGGGIYCWGDGNSGALGTGALTMQSVPTRIVQ